jgi:hypothetical protein
MAERSKTAPRPRKTVTATPKRPARRPRPASGGVTFEQVRAVALTFPEVVEATSYGTAALKVRGKLLARVHQSMDCLVLRADLLDREILMQSAPEVFFITDHYRDHPWVLVRFATLARQALPDLIERAWRLVAPMTLVKARDATR